MLEERNIFISEKTLSRRMKEKGLVSRVALSKPALSEVQASKHIELACYLINLPQIFFETFLFVDESQIVLNHKTPIKNG